MFVKICLLTILWNIDEFKKTKLYLLLKMNDHKLQEEGHVVSTMESMPDGQKQQRR